VPIRDLILKIRDEWPAYRSKRVTNNKASLYQNVVHEFPKLLASLTPQKDLYKFMGSTGHGNITSAPWVASLYKKMTTSPTKEYYLVYLFSVDMKTIYLSIAFGVTDFEKKFGKNMYVQMREGARRLQELHFVTSRFIKGEIDLAATKRDRLHVGYQKSNIYALKYQISNLPEEKQLIKDYREMLEHYRAMATNEMIIPMGEMVEEIANPELVPYQFTVPRLLQPREKPEVYKDKGENRKQGTGGEKRRSKESKKVGDRGEVFVLENEQDFLIKAGRADLAAKVDYVAFKNCGWDITSYDPDGQIKYIEVKSTSAKTINSFDITVNEWEKASNPELAKNYFIYLVTETLSAKPQIRYIPFPLEWVKSNKAEIFPVVFKMIF
jgi:hypothetical protein